MKRKLEAVRYSARYALGLFYDAKTELNLPYEMSYLNDDPIFRFVAVDNIKRNRRKFHQISPAFARYALCLLTRKSVE